MSTQSLLILICKLALVGLGLIATLNVGHHKTAYLGANCLPTQGATGLSLGLFELAQPESLQQTSNTPALERILADNFDGEFASTENALTSINDILESFAVKERLDKNNLTQGHEITHWLISSATSGQHEAAAAAAAANYQATALDYMYGTFWSQFFPLIKRIITERPAGASSMRDLAFRCEFRAQEIQSLNERATKSALYRILLDVFYTELYTHCLRRKMATLRLEHVEPPVLLRQLVDAYLELPLNVVAAGGANFRLTDSAKANFVGLTYANHGQAFDLQRAISHYGPIERAVQLVLLTNNMSLGGVDEIQAKALATKFRGECSSYTSDLLQYWANFDQVAALLSSETNNLTDFNNRIKYALPHLIYASVCNQLLSVD